MYATQFPVKVATSFINLKLSPPKRTALGWNQPVGAKCLTARDSKEKIRARMCQTGTRDASHLAGATAWVQDGHEDGALAVAVYSPFLRRTPTLIPAHSIQVCNSLPPRMSTTTDLSLDVLTYAKVCLIVTHFTCLPSQGNLFRTCSLSRLTASGINVRRYLHVTFSKSSALLNSQHFCFVRILVRVVLPWDVTTLLLSVDS
ncbi:hypothetical protein K438DRAFT_1941261 [Mycena galopus ATCC 62051]|nr:hypothetical protein K438DRAFT_1941261 [Mycena galopus ATCC 62051]